MTAAAASEAYAWTAHARRCAPGEPQPAMLVAPDGARLTADFRPAVGGARAGIVALHSFGDYRRAFATLGARLAQRGVATLAFDQRGFGASGPHGRWAQDEDAYRRDVIGAVGALARRLGGAPVFALGESMGAAAALVAAPDLGARLAGLIVVNPAVRTGHPLRGVLDLLIFGAAALVPGAVVRLARRSRWGHPEATARLSRDPAIVRAVRADTYAGCVRLADRASEAAARVTQPMLIYYGARDWLISAGSVHALAAEAPADVDLVVDAHAPHLPLQALGRDRVFAEIVAWLERRLTLGASVSPSACAAATRRAEFAVSTQGADAARDRAKSRRPPLALAPPRA